MIVRTIRLSRRGGGWFGDRLAIEIPYEMIEKLGWKARDNIILTIADGKAELRLRREDYDEEHK